jgi:pyruvate/2-oxoglutarate/acetoin dehydrogenase E1 component
MTRELSYTQALFEATDQAMASDSSVFVYGMGVDDPLGIYGTTRGLAQKYGADRCFDTPLSEDAMTGVGIGAAMAGLRPIHVHIRMDFVLLAMNQLVNMAAKVRYMYGGTLKCPLIVRAMIGRSWGQGPQHSQAFHGMLAHVPGLRVMAPSTPYDAKGCLLQALQADDPVIFVEHRMVHFQKGPVPEMPYQTPRGRARVLQSGDDVTLVGISYMAVECQRAARHLADVGILAEVIDPVSLAPLDVDTIAASVERTGRLVVVDTDWLTGGLTSEIITAVLEYLEGRRVVQFRRIGFAATPCPTTRPLENPFYPTPEGIAEAAHAMVRATKPWKPSPRPAKEIVEFKGPF